MYVDHLFLVQVELLRNSGDQVQLHLIKIQPRHQPALEDEGDKRDRMETASVMEAAGQGAWMVESIPLKLMSLTSYNKSNIMMYVRMP